MKGKKLDLQNACEFYTVVAIKNLKENYNEIYPDERQLRKKKDPCKALFLNLLIDVQSRKFILVKPCF